MGDIMENGNDLQEVNDVIVRSPAAKCEEPEESNGDEDGYELPADDNVASGAATLGSAASKRGEQMGSTANPTQATQAWNAHA